MSEATVKCEACGSVFSRNQSEVNRSRRLGRRIFCSKGCSNTGQRRPVTKPLGAPSNLKKGSKSDKFSPFRSIARSVRSRHSSKGVKVSSEVQVEDLYNLWHEQEGKCALSGIQMELPQSTTEWEENPATPKRVSLDRLDHDLPYQKGNVRFVTYMANICRNTFKDSDVIEFCKAVSDYNC